MCQIARRLPARQLHISRRSNSQLADVGTLSEIEMPVAKQLNMRNHLPAPLSKQMDTLGEVVTLVSRR